MFVALLTHHGTTIPEQFQTVGLGIELGIDISLQNCAVLGGEWAVKTFGTFGQARKESIEKKNQTIAD